MPKQKKDVCLTLENVSKVFAKVESDEVTHALQDVSVTMKSGEFVSLVGPSGCGKSTILRLVAGLITPTLGRVAVDGTEVEAPSPERGVVFQNPTLFPWLTVEKNIAFSLDIRGMKDGKAERVDRMIRMIGLEKFRNDYPAQLSGGMAQRVALVRTLINEPEILLLDEPLGALDLKLRKDMQVELKNIQQRMEITFIYVTHDQEEALSMSDTVVVMDSGSIQQIGTPQDIYNEPVNAFVADFIGESNILDGVMHEDYLVSFSGKKFRCLDTGFGKNESVDVVVRPEDVDVVPLGEGMLSGTVTSVTFKGLHYEIIIDIGGFKWMIQTTDYSGVGERVGLKIDPDAIHIMKKSEYSGTFGDYSSFSEELDHLSELDSEPEEETPAEEEYRDE